MNLKKPSASKEHAICKPNPECTYCLGRHACEALQRSTLSITDLTLLNTPWQLKPHSVGNELRYLKRAAELLDARITGLEEQATSHIKKGERIPFFKLEQGKGRDRWKTSAEEIITLGEMLGYDLAKPREVVTPNQAAKLGVSEEIVNAYVERTPGAFKLTLDEEHNARKIFGDNK